MSEKSKFLKAYAAANVDGSDPKWSEKLEKALGYHPADWDGKGHGRDQLIGILRRLEDGKDPYEEERRDSFVEFMDDLSVSTRIDRDQRDGQLGRDVDSGAWRRAPDAIGRAPLKPPPSLFKQELGLA